MIIGIDASRAGAEQKTGTEWYSHHLLKNIAKIDSERSYVLYTDKDRPLARDLELPANFKEKKLSWPLPFLWTQGGLSLEMFFKAPDILFVPAHAIPFVHPRKTITTIHDVGFRQWGHFLSKKERDYLDWSTAFAVARANRIITVSEFSKNELVRLFSADPDRVDVIYLGYDQETYRPLVDQEYLSMLLESCGVSKPYLLCIGRLDQRKNIHNLIIAFEYIRREIPGIELVLVGPLGAGGQDIERQLQLSASRNSIKHIGWISEEQKVGLLNGCSALVFPTLYEGFGLPVLEAQSCGAPVVCSSVSSLPEIAGEGAMLFNPTIPQDIAEKVCRVLSDSLVRDELVRRGRENCSRFSWEQTARQTLEVLLSQSI